MGVQLGHVFNLRFFPFGVHHLPIQLALRRQRDSARFFLQIADKGFCDDDESIPFYGSNFVTEGLTTTIDLLLT